MKRQRRQSYCIDRIQLSRGAILSRSLFLLVLSVALLSPLVASSAIDWNKNAFSTVLLPQDVSYDNAARKALQRIRRLEQQQVVLEELVTSGNDNQVTLTMMGFKGGRLLDQINQDRAFVCINDAAQFDDASSLLPVLILGVLDGHGPKGERVAQYALEQIPQRLSAKLQHVFTESAPTSQEAIDDLVKQALKETFVEIDESIPDHAGGDKGGCTASIVLQLNDKLYIANTGDSISFVAIHNHSTNTTKTIYTTREDKPHLPDEYERITQMGGVVNIPDDEYEDSSRVMYTDPETGYQVGLAMSRSIGDKDMVGVIAEPLVDVVDLQQVIINERKGNEEASDGETCTISNENICIFAVSATDGMMDYLSPTEVASSLAQAFYQNDSLHPLIVTEELILRAAKGWNNEMNGEYRDDIAIAASKVVLPQHSCRQFDDGTECSSSSS